MLINYESYQSSQGSCPILFHVEYDKIIRRRERKNENHNADEIADNEKSSEAIKDKDKKEQKEE